ncbi:hypothetical protein [Haloferula sp.]|uniref:hypothetical protein n=1 Tax=Haloferula sp. TaxID=2497595 RepID=UPI003C77C2FD
MSTIPDNLPTLVIGTVIGAWLLAITGILVMRRYYSRRLDRLGEASSEEMIKELDSAYRRAPRVRIQTQTEYLPFVIETIRENIDAGLADQQVETLLSRIENHRLGDERQAMFPVEVQNVSSELRLRWTCDAQYRIDLRIQGDPAIVAALQELKKRIPKAAIYGQTGHS